MLYWLQGTALLLALLFNKLEIAMSKQVTVKHVVRMLTFKRLRVGKFSVSKPSDLVEIITKRVIDNKVIFELENGQRVTLTVEVS